jgi:hypothetical protein
MPGCSKWLRVTVTLPAITQGAGAGGERADGPTEPAAPQQSRVTGVGQGARCVCIRICIRARASLGRCHPGAGQPAAAAARKADLALFHFLQAWTWRLTAWDDLIANTMTCTFSCSGCVGHSFCTGHGDNLNLLQFPDSLEQKISTNNKSLQS